MFSSVKRFVLGVLAVSGLLYAGVSMADNSSILRRDCSVYSNQPQVCNRVQGCFYDYQWNACEGNASGGRDGGNRACSAYSGSPQLCNRQAGCTYDHRFQQCQDTFGGGNGSQCYFYHNDPRTCSLMPGCVYDARNRSCDRLTPGPGPGPGPRPRLQTAVIHCASGRARYTRCTVPGQLVNAVILRVVSAARCDQGRSWGMDIGGLWVDRGCRADFRVTFQTGRF